VCMPFFGDQWEWAETVCKHLKAGVQVNKLTSSAAEVREAVQRVVKQPEYRNAAAHARERVLTEQAAKMQKLGLALTEETRPGVALAGAIIEAVAEGSDPACLLPREAPAPKWWWSCCRTL